MFRVFDYPITIADKITKLIASGDNFHFTQALAHNKLLFDYKRHYEEAFHIIERIIGLPRQTGTHAAGIIIADRSLNDYIPIRHGANNVIQSQYGMHYLKAFGLIKMDILGLRNLTLLKEMIKVIAQKENIHYDLETLDRNDQKTFALLRKGDTLGLFQLESPGMTRLLLKMQVVSLNDLSAVLALYRPGAMQNIDRYLQARKQGLQVKTRLERVIAQISADTYGFLIYQEQIMMLASVIAQFDLAKADYLRKAMSKKDHALILSLKKDFYTQGATNGYNQQELDYSWQLIEQFAAYGFNKSHSISYALIGYWMAFFKANWPQYFYTTMLNYMTNSASQTKIYLDALREAGLKIAAPSVNHANSNSYSITNKTVFLPLQLIKQIGQQTANAIADERTQNGKFQNVFDFWNRLAWQRFNKKQFEALIYSGALACFDINQETLLANFFVLQDYQKVVYYNNELITGVATPLLTEQATKKPMLYWIHKQQEYLGFYVNDHPVALLRSQYNLTKKTTFLNAVGSKPAFIVALITSCSFIHDKNNHKMAFLNIADETTQISVVLFANMLHNNQNVQENDFLLAKIKKQPQVHKNNYDLLEVKIIPASNIQ